MALVKNLARFEAKKQSYFMRVQRAFDDTAQLDNPQVLKNFVARLENLTKTREEYSRLIDDIADVKSQMDDSYVPNYECLNAFDDLYGHVLLAARDPRVIALQKPTTSDKPIQGTSPELRTRLPKINLPTFSGKLDDWPNFYESFKGLIHDNLELSNTDKINYLVGLLSGKAATLCAGLPAIGGNYPVLWQRLVEKYQNPRLLASYYLDKLFEFKTIIAPSANSFNAMIEKCDFTVQALKNLGINDLLDFVFAYILYNKLDTPSKNLFENKRNDTSLFTYGDVLHFIKTQAQIHTVSTFTTNKPSISGRAGVPKHNSNVFFVNKIGPSLWCPVCKREHAIIKCPQFLARTAKDRYAVIKSHNLCINCFGEHKVETCQSKYTCRECQSRHNTLLHFGKLTKNSTVPSSKFEHNEFVPLTPIPSTSVNLCSTLMEEEKAPTRCTTVLLSTVVVHVIDNAGRSQNVRMLLDSGSQANFLTSSCVRRLNLSVQPSQATIKGLGCGDRPVLGNTQTVIYSRIDQNVSYKIQALIVDNIVSHIPNCKIPTQSLSHLKNILLADEDFHLPSAVDGIIGAQLFPIIIGSRKIIGAPCSPIALETKFGFVVMGTVPANRKLKQTKSFSTFVDPPLEQLVSKFWEEEEIPSQPFPHPDIIECEKIFKSTVSRNTDGGYVVSLPFKLSPTLLGDSFRNAQRCLFSLEKRLRNNPVLRQQYNEVLHEYLLKGYMSPSRKPIRDLPNYVIPHHCVLRNDSVSTPIRCVFNASCESSSKWSLNSLLYTGPKLQKDVTDIFINFRLFPVCFTADIKQMYLRIGVLQEHRKFQRILWRFSESQPVTEYQLNTVTFGVKSSPYLALRTLKQLAEDEGTNYPLASEILNRDFYVDDLLCSLPNLDMARKAYLELITMLACGKFQLTKWAASSEALLADIPEPERSPKVVNFDNDGLKVLGLLWYPGSDIFTFSISSENLSCTKRHVLSTVARLFDPCGFVSPVTLIIKLFIRRLWTLKMDWDALPPQDMVNEWKVIQDKLILLKQFEIPRHLGVISGAQISLVGFCDACINSYGAVIYIRTATPPGNVTTGFICAKTKVAPIKSQTIPRLELSAALLLAKLLNFVKNSLKSRIEINSIFALTDSMVALHWITSPPYRWQTYVANRVAQIQSLSDKHEWWHINGKQNISDCLSRGLTPDQLLDMPDWKEGPTWLRKDPSCWPLHCASDSNLVNAPEEKTISLVVERVQAHLLLDLCGRFSSLKRLLRCVVFVLRFAKVLTTTGVITVFDLESAEMRLVAVIQQIYFADDLVALQNNQKVSPKLQKLSPFLQDGLIRVGGRLCHSSMVFENQHPLVLPNKNTFIDLLIDDCHVSNLHTGPALVLSILRQRFWILGARNTIRYRLQRCNHCFKLNPRHVFPKMADLPKFRVNEAKPFMHCGTDFCGPFRVTLGRRRGVISQKAYVCLFLCLATKAVHLELVSSLSTDLFIAAFKRFLSRRGACSTIYSDRGTNYIGAKHELDDLYKLMESKNFEHSLLHNLSDYRIHWVFNPPSSPHFGGVWESQIKCVKSHLYKAVGQQILTFEELTTVLTQIEAILNSRPLSWLSSDPADAAPLTPAHFLTLSPLRYLPAPQMDQFPNLSQRKRLLDQIIQTFWNRWHLEYLTQLQVKQKWYKDTTNISPGTLVIIKQDNVPPLHWPIGVIEDIMPGRDNVVRVVRVRTATGIYTRPVVKLCPLPTQ